MSETNTNADLRHYLSPDQASAVLVQCADVTILLNDELEIEEVFSAIDFDVRRLDQWKGRPFVDCVSSDSRPKVEYLFLDNNFSTDCEGRWRHLNLCIDGKPTLPLLMKYFCFEDERGLTRLICARDLRPLLGMQERFQREVDLLGNEKAVLERKIGHRQ